MGYRPPLHIHIVYHPSFVEGGIWSEHLVKWFSGDPDAYAVPPADIPTFVWTSVSPDEVPPEVPIAEAQRTVVILLVDRAWLAEPQWRSWASSLLDTASAIGDEHAVVVVALHPNAIHLGGSLSRRNAIRLEGGDKNKRFEELRLRLTHYIAKHILGGVTTSIFLSHTKAGARPGDNGGRDLAVALKSFLNQRPLGTVFFDEVSIEAGEDFVERLKQGVGASVVVVLLTERFSGRYWCKWEVMMTKQHRRPMLLVDALEEGEPLNLAYAGNVRTIRWSRECADDEVMHYKVIAGALLELLRVEHNRLRIFEIGPIVGGEARTESFGHTPELATLPAPSGDTMLILHPDPPLAPFEVEVMRRNRPDLKFASVTQALAGTAVNRTTLNGRRIAISISEGQDRAVYGLTALHQKRLWERLATLLLAAGAELAYGGDLRQGGYTIQLWDLIRGTLDAGDELPDGVVHSYLGWPLSLTITEDERAALPSAIRIHVFSKAAGLTLDPHSFIPPSTYDSMERFAWAVSMTEMRAAIARDCHARVVVGGQLRSVSPIPGLVEEFLTFAPDKPTYLVGGFGGMARVIGRAMLGKQPEELTRSFQEEEGRRSAIFDFYAEEVATGRWPQLEPLDFEGIVRRLAAIGFDGLDNGLTKDENLQLFHSRDILQITSLVLTGLIRKLGVKSE